MKAFITKGSIELVPEYQWEAEVIEKLKDRTFKATDYLTQNRLQKFPRIFLDEVDKDVSSP